MGTLQERQVSTRIPASQLKFGTRDALLFYHCGVIATKLGRADEARQHMADALDGFHLPSWTYGTLAVCQPVIGGPCRLFKPVLMAMAANVTTPLGLRRSPRSIGRPILVIIACLLLSTRMAGIAHPMGNFSVNHLCKDRSAA